MLFPEIVSTWILRECKNLTAAPLHMFRRIHFALSSLLSVQNRNVLINIDCRWHLVFVWTLSDLDLKISICIGWLFKSSSSSVYFTLKRIISGFEICISLKRFQNQLNSYSNCLYLIEWNRYFANGRVNVSRGGWRDQRGWNSVNGELKDWSIQVWGDFSSIFAETNLFNQLAS